MQFEARTTIRGRMRYMLYDASGKRLPIPTDRGEMGGGHWVNNLITDRGLNLIPTYNVFSASLLGWRNYSGVGTGSVAPAFSDTALNTEVSRVSSDGGFDSVGSSFVDGVTNELVQRVTLTRVHVFGSSQNVTEYGFTPTDSTGDYVIRELFRDASNDPVTLSIVAGVTLRIDHEIEVRLPGTYTEIEFDIPELDAFGDSTPAITGVTNATPIAITTDVPHGLVTGNKVTISGVAGTTAANGVWVVTRINDTEYSLDASVGNGAWTADTGTMARRYVAECGFIQGDVGRSSGVWNPNITSASNCTLGRYTSAPPDLATNLSSSDGIAPTHAGYVNDSFVRNLSATWTPSQANGTHRGWVWYNTLSGSGSGFRVRLTNPTTFTKQNTHELSLTMRRTWGRA